MSYAEDEQTADESRYVERMVRCEVCGAIPSEASDEMYEPKIEVEAENMGVPWLYRITCGVCGRVVRGVGEDAAINNWNAGQTDGYVELDGEDGS